MKEKTLGKVLLLVAITILLVGLVSATTTNKTTTKKDTKVIKNTTITSAKTETIKTTSKKTKTDNIKVTDKKTIKDKENKIKNKTKSNSYTTTASSFDELKTKVEDAKTSKYKDYDNYIINLKKGTYISTEELIWGNSEGTKLISLNGNESTVIGRNDNHFLKINKNYSFTLKNIVLTNFSIECDFDTTSHGVIENNGDLKIENSKLIDNTAITGFGGAIYNNNSTLTILNSVLSNNKAGACGGAICNTEGTVKIMNSNISNNVANVSGGAISNNGNLNLINTNLYNNQAQTCAAIYTPSNPIDNNLFISNCTFNKNVNTVKVSAILGIDRTTGSIFNTKFINNIGGTTILLQGREFSIIKCVFYNNTGAYRGGAIENYASLTINNSIFNNNCAEINGTIFTQGNLILTNCTINNHLIPYLSKKFSPYVSDHRVYLNIDNDIIPSISTKITLKLNTTKTYKGSKVKATITLKDNKGNIFPNQKVTVKFGEKIFTIKTNNKGQATATYKTTNTGTVLVTAYAGTIEYKNATKYIKIKVLPKIKTKLTLTLSKTKAKVKDKINVSVTLKNKSNKAIKSQKVAIKIGSKTYTKKTNKKGTITLTYKVVKSALGKAIKATYKGNYMYLSSKASIKLLKA